MCLTKNMFSLRVMISRVHVHVIALSDGDSSKIYRVMDGKTVVGHLDMKDLVKALVPRLSSSAK